MRHWIAGHVLAFLVAAFGAGIPEAAVAGIPSTGAQVSLDARLDRLEAEIIAAEDMRAIKRLQRAYGYYLDKGMWEDLAALFTDDAVANYPAGVFVGKQSIRRHLFLNVGSGKLGEIGLGDNRLYNHMSIQPVVHLDPGGKTAKGRWRAFAMFGAFGANATWAEGVYEVQYAKVDGVWKISKLDYHAGFAAPYETGWIAPQPAKAGSSAATPVRARRSLRHPPDRERKMECEGFPAACLAPFHYENPGTTPSAHAWDATTLLPAVRSDRNARRRAADLAHRAMLLRDEQQVENLQRIYGYYLDRAMWDHVADLFTDDGTIEWAQQGVYVGRKRVREFLGSLGRHGLTDGWLNEHIQLQIIATVAPDGRTARARSRQLRMTGRYQGTATWEEGIYENTFVKQDGVWKIRSVHYFPTFITDYDKGWAKDARPAPGANTALPPDRPPTQVYAIYPKAHVPPFHYRNPVTGSAPRYPVTGGPDKATAAAMLEPASRAFRPRPTKNVEAAIAEAERNVSRVKDVHELENLESAYGYYLDKNLWNALADLFAEDGSMELAQRGVYKGRERVREFLLGVFGRGKEGPVAGRLGNHIQMQPVIHVADDGQSARIRQRMFQQMSFGPRASLGGAIYENEAVKENGVWKFRTVRAFNTFSAGYESGWTRNVNGAVPGPSADLPPDAPPTRAFRMFPAVYDIPFHYANPVSGRTETPQIEHVAALQALTETSGTTRAAEPAATASGGGTPPEIARALREIGPRIEGKQTTALYAPLHPKEPYENVSLTRDLAYGPHERHRLDVFVSPEKGRGKPVVVFIHGGGFSGGAKRAPNSPFYDNVGLWAARHGLVGVTINYRLAPEFQYPSGIEDLTRVIDWLRQHIVEYGGDPGKIFLWGHSAGAAHAADYLAHAANTGKDSFVAGAILTSGFYVLGPEVSVWKAYYGEDVSKYAERSSLPGLVKSTVPLFVVDAGLDPETFRPESDRLAEARARAGRPVRRLHLPQHSHLSELYAVNTSDESHSRPVLEFVRSVSENAQ
jgi:acetyl esterase/lipase